MNDLLTWSGFFLGKNMVGHYSYCVRLGPNWIEAANKNNSLQ